MARVHHIRLVIPFEKLLVLAVALVAAGVRGWFSVSRQAALPAPRTAGELEQLYGAHTAAPAQLAAHLDALVGHAWFLGEAEAMAKAMRATRGFAHATIEHTGSEAVAEKLRIAEEKYARMLATRGLASEADLTAIASRAEGLAHSFLARTGLERGHRLAALTALARIYHALGQSAQAESAAREALAIDARSVPARLALSTVLIEQQRYEDAKRELHETRRLLDEWVNQPGSAADALLRGRYTIRERHLDRERKRSAASLSLHIATEISLINSIQEVQSRVPAQQRP